MVQRQADAADLYAGWLTTWSAFLTLCLFALVPAFAVGTIPDAVSAIDFYLHGEGVVDGELLSRWWFFWSFFTTMAALVFLQRTYATIRALQLAPSVLPRPPRAPGEPPMCRVCCGPLSGRGRVQPCTYCGATHLMTGAHLDDHARTVDDRLRSLEAEAERAAEQGEATSLSLGLWTMIFTFAGPSIAVALAHFAFEGPRPDLWGLTAAFAVLALVAYGLSRRFAFPSVPHPNSLQLSDLVALRGQYRTTAARLRGPWDGIIIVFDGHEDALLLDYEDGAWTGKAVAIAPGGEPLTKKQVLAEGRDSKLWPVDVAVSDGVLLPVAPGAFSHPGPKSHQVRIWDHRPSAGVGATLTLSLVADLEPREFLIVGPP